jgi:uncharacterized protein (TIGR02594 family)
MGLQVLNAGGTMPRFSFQPPHGLPSWASLLPHPLPRHLEIAFHYDGEHEIPGVKNNPDFMALLDFSDGKQDGRTLGAQNDDEAYCAKAHCACYELADIVSPRSAMARSFLPWGINLDGGPAFGCTVVLDRGAPFAHDTWAIGRDTAGHLIGFGFNQADGAQLSRFDPARILGYRWPKELPIPAVTGFTKLPLLALADGKLSSNER